MATLTWTIRSGRSVVAFYWISRMEERGVLVGHGDAPVVDLLLGA